MVARATVIIPTFGNARFARWAIKGVQQQTVKDIEICVICDGSPEDMVSFFKELEKEDPRLKVYAFPKSLRTGEPYRDPVIKQTSGSIICYCCHDDLWLPYHIEEMEKSLASCSFTHSLHAFVKVPKDIRDGADFVGGVYWTSLKDKDVVARMLMGENFFGLTFGAHTRKSYNELKEGWVTTPYKDMPTDLYMWRKFLLAFRSDCDTVMKITALHLRKLERSDWSEQERDDELGHYFKKINDPEFLQQIEKQSLRFRPPLYRKIMMKIMVRTHLRQVMIKIHIRRRIKNLLKRLELLLDITKSTNI
jgi:glycosyltransferase involved in cell wall biosynthesis